MTSGKLVSIVCFIAAFQCINASALPNRASKDAPSVAATSPPLVIWHGINDSCCDPDGVAGHLMGVVKTHAPDLSVYSIKIGDSSYLEKMSSIFANVNSHVDAACSYIASLEDAKDGYNALGISQGGQLLRAVAQRCPDPPMLNLVTLGSQHQGVFGISQCESMIDTEICNCLLQITDTLSYSDMAQQSVVPFQFWNNPITPDVFKAKSGFLADINNIAAGKFNVSYRNNLMKLQNFVMVKFHEDDFVVPKESSWFGFYGSGGTNDITPMNQTEVYVNDTIGLQEMDKANKLVFLDAPGAHLNIDDSWFLSEIVDKYLLGN